MSRFSKCLNYQIKTKLKGTLIFLGFYIAIWAALFTMISFGGGNFNASLSFAAVVFVFVYVIVDYKSKTNYLMMFGNTRKNIFFSSLLSNVAISAFLTAISAVASIIEGVISRFSNHYEAGESMLAAIYPESGMGSEIIYILALLILLTSVSTIYSALSYKLGRVFTIPFWVTFGLSFMLLPLPGSIDIIKAFFCYGMSNGILLAPVNFLVTSLVLYALSYAAAIRQPQVV